MAESSHVSDAGSAAGALRRLYELRTEPALRQARAWFTFEFHPATTAEVLHTWLGRADVRSAMNPRPGRPLR